MGKKEKSYIIKMFKILAFGGLSSFTHAKLTKNLNWNAARHSFTKLVCFMRNLGSMVCRSTKGPQAVKIVANHGCVLTRECM
jgi:hypothetical protein